MRQAQRRSARQYGAAASRAHHRAPQRRCRLAASGLGRDAAFGAGRRGGAEFHQRAPPQDLVGLKEQEMSAFDSFPLGQPAFVTNVLDRAAHLRLNDEKLFALEQKSSSRAYVVYRDSLLVKREGDGVRALLSIDEAVKCGANPGTIFLGLRDGTALFGMGLSQAASEQLVGRQDYTVTELRGMAMQGAVPPDQLSAIAMAKSMVSWHQRHGFCANCGARTAM